MQADSFSGAPAYINTFQIHRKAKASDDVEQGWREICYAKIYEL
jgi:hypothetical protein